MFKRWESLVCPLRCVVVVMKESAVSRIFRGAAKRGIEALSELDASRVDLVNRKRDVNWRVIDKHLRKVMRGDASLIARAVGVRERPAVSASS